MFDLTATVFKYILNTLGGFLLMVGTMIEPSIGVWVVSVGGSLLTSSLGKEDKSIREVSIHLIIGIFWGIFGSQVLHALDPSVPQIAIAFFSAMFGVEATWYMIRNFRNGSMALFIAEIISNTVSSIVPWFKKK